MTDANRESCSLEGENDERRIDDRFAVCVVDDTAGFAVEEVFETTPLSFLFFPMAISNEMEYWIWCQVDQ